MREKNEKEINDTKEMEERGTSNKNGKKKRERKREKKPITA